LRQIEKSDHEFLHTSGFIGCKALSDRVDGPNEAIGPDITRENKLNSV
jgi:hypothetical protein